MKTKKLSKKSSLNNSIIASILFLAIFVLASLTMIAKSTCPFIEYRFDHRQIDGNTLLNVAKNAGNVYNGKINGTPSIVKGFGPAIDDKAMQFDDIDDYVEASGSKDIDFSQGVTVEAKICRRNNINEDAIVGKWYG
ncbi:MAG: hypothetical protein MUF15_17985, partial [Acidobacteria bacterium]|nr:hypothetical protein [Acidobacteriota bacterium]